MKEIELLEQISIQLDHLCVGLVFIMVFLFIIIGVLLKTARDK